MSKIILLILLLMPAVSFSQYYLDSAQAIKTIKIKAQRDSLLIVTDYLQTENDSLKSGIAIRDMKISSKQNIINMQDTIMLYMEKQIKKLENTPIIKQEIKTNWYVWAGVIISSICAGMITGFIIK